MSYFKISPKKIFLVAIVAALAVSLAIPSVGVFASSGSLTVKTAKHSYSGTETIKVFGAVIPTPPKGTLATIKITDPHGVPVATATTLVVMGAFTSNFVSGGALWKLSGTYTVTATVGSTSATTTFTYTA